MTATTFASKRTPGATVISDRDSGGKFRRSVVGNLDLAAATVRAARGTPEEDAYEPGGVHAPRPGVGARTVRRRRVDGCRHGRR